MQCQFGIFLEDSLTFLLGDLKEIKIYNIFRLFFWSPHKLTTGHDLPGWRMSTFSSPEGGEQGDGGRGGLFFFFFNSPLF